MIMIMRVQNMDSKSNYDKTISGNTTGQDVGQSTLTTS